MARKTKSSERPKVSIVCPDCGAVEVVGDVFERGEAISGECPGCGDRLYFAKPSEPVAVPGRFAILIRHPGWLDRFARRDPRPDYPADDFNAWIAHDKDQAGEWAWEADARAHAARLAEQFAGPDFEKFNRYRFDVCREKYVPRWFLVDPKDDRETAPVGSRGQM